MEEVLVGGLTTDYCVKNTVLDALKEGFRVKVLENAMRPVDLQPGDGERAIEEMREAGAEMQEQADPNKKQVQLQRLELLQSSQ